MKANAVCKLTYVSASLSAGPSPGLQPPPCQASVYFTPVHHSAARVHECVHACACVCLPACCPSACHTHCCHLPHANCRSGCDDYRAGMGWVWCGAGLEGAPPSRKAWRLSGWSQSLNLPGCPVLLPDSSSEIGRGLSQQSPGRALVDPSYCRSLEPWVGIHSWSQRCVALYSCC